MAATPIAAPTLRENWLSAVAIPSRERSTPCCTASSSDSICVPMPAPMTVQLVINIQLGESPSTSVSPKNPIVISTLPAIDTVR